MSKQQRSGQRYSRKDSTSQPDWGRLSTRAPPVQDTISLTLFHRTLHANPIWHAVEDVSILLCGAK
jgi:hypothetical protein